MIKILGLAACILSLATVRPALGSNVYAIMGVCVGLAAVFVAAYIMRREAINTSITAGASLMVGALAGVVWPAAIAAGLVWINLGGGRRPTPDA